MSVHNHFRVSQQIVNLISKPIGQMGFMRIDSYCIARRTFISRLYQRHVLAWQLLSHYLFEYHHYRLSIARA